MRFAQESGGISISLPTPDWSTLIPNLVGLIFDAVGEWMTKAEHAALDWFVGGATNLLASVPLDKTWDFGPVHTQVADVIVGARAVLLFAVILLGLKSMLGGVVHRHADVISDFVDGVLMSVIMVAAFPVVIPLAIGLTNQAAQAVAGSAGLGAYLAVEGSPGGAMLEAVLFLILAFFAVRLLLKAIWRIGFLAVLLPFGLVACALYGIPQTRWMLGWWSRVWGGMLVAQIPSAFALAIGLGLAGGGGAMGFLFSIAFMRLATDLYSLIPFGSIANGGAVWGALPLGAMAMRGLSGGAAGAAAASVPNIRPQMMADQYAGYGYR